MQRIRRRLGRLPGYARSHSGRSTLPVRGGGRAPVRLVASVLDPTRARYVYKHIQYTHRLPRSRPPSRTVQKVVILSTNVGVCFDGSVHAARAEQWSHGNEKFGVFLHNHAGNACIGESTPGALLERRVNERSHPHK